MLGTTLCVMYCALAASGPADGAWLSRSDYGRLQVVVSANPSALEKKAAAEFVKNWKMVTGHEIATVTGNASGPAVYIGMSTLPSEIRARLDKETLGYDAVRLLTFGQGDARGLALVGGAPRGGLYSVYQFFEDYLGVRYVAPDYTYVPPAPENLPVIDFSYAPVFQRRATQMPLGADEDVYRVTTGPKFGMYGHNLYDLVPPEKYFATHPEHFSEIDGVRIAPTDFDWHDLKAREGKGTRLGQLCMSNPEVARLIADELGRRIEKRPDATVWSVNQMDWANYCQCPNCKALDEQEGTPMGSYLTGINRIADILAKEHPGYLIHTYAYAYTRKPVKHIKPRPNVIVELCTIECSFVRPLTDKSSSTNAEFIKDFRAWRKLATNLYVYNYPWNYTRYQRPHPNFRVIGPNIRLFADMKAMGVHEQGPGVHPLQYSTEFGGLRTYMIAKLLWNPYADAQAIMDEYINLYYQEAAPYIKEYIALLEKTLDASGYPMSCFDPGNWIDAKMVAEARRIFAEARAAAKSDEVRKRLDVANISVELAALECKPDITIENNVISMTRPPSLTIDEYFNLIESYGVKMSGENVPNTEAVKAFHWGTLPRKQQSKMIVTENDSSLLWTAPDFAGGVIRWQDKTTGREWFNGFVDVGLGAGSYQDWTSTPYVNEGPVADTYEVVAQGPGTLTLAASRRDGLRVERKMELVDGENALRITLTMTNPTNEPLIPNVKCHPEFNLQGVKAPFIYARQGETWTELNDDRERRMEAIGEVLPNQGRDRLAAWLPKTRATMACSFDPVKTEGILWFYNLAPDRKHFNLEVWPKTDPLKPGQSISQTVTYYTAKKKPPLK